MPTAPLMSGAGIVLSLAGLSGGSPEAAPPTNDGLLVSVARALSGMMARLTHIQCDPQILALEPGRSISGPTQLVLLTVLDIVEAHGRRILICDGGGMSLSPMLLMERHAVFPTAPRSGRVKECTVLGNLPSSLDRVSAAARLPPVHIGDRLAVLDTGAYFASMSTQFAGPRPALVMVDGAAAVLVRRRETYQDLIQRDTMSEDTHEATHQ